MARRTFFSFHYDRDVWRATNVRKSSQFTPSVDQQWIDASMWEDAKRQGDPALRRLILDGLRNTSVTVVLVGNQTSTRRWVRFEIEQSIERGNGLLGVYIHNIRDQFGMTDYQGSNPLPFSYPTYDWVYNDGRNNLGSWVEKAWTEAHG